MVMLGVMRRRGLSVKGGGRICRGLGGGRVLGSQRRVNEVMRRCEGVLKSRASSQNQKFKTMKVQVG